MISFVLRKETNLSPKMDRGEVSHYCRYRKRTDGGRGETRGGEAVVGSQKNVGFYPIRSLALYFERRQSSYQKRTGEVSHYRR
jgi:hypothetical protein